MVCKVEGASGVYRCGMGRGGRRRENGVSVLLIEKGLGRVLLSWALWWTGFGAGFIIIMEVRLVY